MPSLFYMKDGKKVKYTPKSSTKTVRKSVPATRSAPTRTYGRSTSGYRKPYYANPNAAVKGRGGYGRKIGASLGDAAENVLRLGAKIIGFGDYAAPQFQPKQNSLMKSMVGGDPPSVRNAKNGGFIVRHREYLQDVITGGSPAYNSVQIPINVGLNGSFPWLSSIASQFEMWKPRGIVYEFKSTSADALNATNTALGTVIMATEYDSSRGPAPFVNKQQMENHEFSSSARQSCSMMHPIECESARNPLGTYYTRFGNQPANFDLRMTDLGIFVIATQGQQGTNVNIGELWVTYEIEFLKPQLISQLGYQLQAYKAFNSVNVSTAAYFGTLANLVVRPGSIMNMTLTSNQIIFPPALSEGTFLIVYNVQGATPTAGVSPPTLALTNCTIANMWVNDGQGSVQQGTLTTAIMSQTYAVNITNFGASIQLSGGPLPTVAIVYMDLLVTQLNGGIQT